AGGRAPPRAHRGRGPAFGSAREWAGLGRVGAGGAPVPPAARPDDGGSARARPSPQSDPRQGPRCRRPLGREEEPLLREKPRPRGSSIRFPPSGSGIAGATRRTDPRPSGSTCVASTVPSCLNWCPMVGPCPVFLAAVALAALG